MNCREWEERLALYAGGDLQPPQKAEVERHVQDCAGCQLFLSGLTDGLQVLQDAHAEELAPAHFAAVRAWVLAELGGERRPWWAKRRVYGLAVAALVLVLVFWRWPAAWKAPQPEVAMVPAPAVLPVPPPEPVRTVQVRRHARRRPPAHPKPVPEPAQPLVVKLVTDDPDVVIYWITETRGE
jgi:hypothetical protein